MHLDPNVVGPLARPGPAGLVAAAAAAAGGGTAFTQITDSNLHSATFDDTGSIVSANSWSSGQLSLTADNSTNNRNGFSEASAYLVPLSSLASDVGITLDDIKRFRLELYIDVITMANNGNDFGFLAGLVHATSGTIATITGGTAIGIWDNTASDRAVSVAGSGGLQSQDNVGLTANIAYASIVMPAATPTVVLSSKDGSAYTNRRQLEGGAMSSTTSGLYVMVGGFKPGALNANGETIVGEFFYRLTECGDVP